jgi:REP element-mobilizing transposase RayT
MPLISSGIEKRVFEFISVQLRELGCPVRIINGMPGHIYCLFLLKPQKSVAEVLKQIKGSSLHYISQNNLIA